MRGGVQKTLNVETIKLRVILHELILLIQLRSPEIGVSGVIGAYALSAVGEVDNTEIVIVMTHHPRMVERGVKVMMRKRKLVIPRHVVVGVVVVLD